MLRQAEWISLAFFAATTAIGLARVSGRTRAGVFALGGLGTLLTLVGVWSQELPGNAPGSTLRDWLPVFQIPLAYRLAGLLFRGPNGRLQAHLRKIDDFFAVPIARLTGPRAARRYFELMYLTAYPVVPAGLALLRFAVPGFEADTFWSVVLPATYFCYFMLPFAPTLPPRMAAEEDSVAGQPDGEPRPARRLNLWILDRFGIGANTFPSGHVAAAAATSLVVLEYLPFTGLLFLWMSLGIAVGAVVLRYHYLADAVLGALVALLVRWIIGA